MAARPRLAVRTGLVALAVAVGAALAAPTPAHADPAVPVPGLSMLDSLSLGAIPLDTELAKALRTLKSAGVDQKAIEALQAILGAEGSPDLNSLIPGDGTTPTPSTPAPETPAVPAAPTVPAAPGTPTTPTTPTVPAVPEPAPVSARPAADPLTSAATGLELFEKLSGAKVLTPAFAPFCALTTDDNPLGLVTAPAVGIPGPFPKGTDGQNLGESLNQMLTGLGLGALADLLDSNQDITAITQALTADQTAYALIPPTGHTNDKFQVAWFNTTSMKGGLADLKPLKDLTSSRALQVLAGSAPIRLARVDTGQGSILTAVFGTTTHAGRTCYFLPAVGIVDTPAT